MSQRSGRTLKGQQKIEERILRFSQEIETWFNLEHTDIRISFNRAPDDDVGTACTCQAKWEYSQATMCWNLDAVIGIKRHQLEELIIHEFVHILLGPIQEFIPDKQVKREEFVTENIARLLIRQWRKHRK